MIPCQNEELIIEAQNCTNCLSWLHHCKAECCKTFRILKTNILFQTENQTIFTFSGGEDLAWYYRIHGCSVVDNYVEVRTDVYGLREAGDYLYHDRPCNYLRENKCNAWESGERPQVCKDFNENTGAHSGSYTTPNCLCNYKPKVKEK